LISAASEWTATNEIIAKKFPKSRFEGCGVSEL
jgi:hypothetical protein